LSPFSEFVILDPKRDSERKTGRASWYPYYAGFSEAFARCILLSAKLDPTSSVGDPWNGSGTTTAAAAGLGHNAYGYDLNPVMVLVARARMLSRRAMNSLVPLGNVIARGLELQSPTRDEPLAVWFSPQTANHLRALERSIQRTLMSVDQPSRILDNQRVQQISDLAAFFYVALFRTTRALLQRFGASNPTWIKTPGSPHSRLRPPVASIEAAFQEQVAAMAMAIECDASRGDSEVRISVGSSDRIPLPVDSVDFILSSPPYCTRIDYAVATQAELSVLGYHAQTEFDALRRKLIGSSTVPAVAPEPRADWGTCCNSFLQQVQDHKSKASAGYYLKNHLQYFDSLYQSLGEISRTLRKQGACVLVIQDSYYKNIHNDLPKTVVEMLENHGMRLVRHQPFHHGRSMARVNPNVRIYRTQIDTTESVLCFCKN